MTQKVPVPFRRSPEDDDRSPRPNFLATVELRVGYRAGEKVTAQIDVEWNNGDSTGRSEYLEQAYVTYAFADKLSLTTGKFTSYAGWVAADADGLCRINAGPIANLYGTELVGGALNFVPTEDFGASLFLVNGLNDPDNTNDNRRLAPALDIVYTLADVGTFNVEGGYDSLSDDRDEVALGANATIKLAAYKPLTLGAEVIWRALMDDATDSEDSRIGALLMANHVIPIAPFPMSATLMGQHITTEVEAGGTTTAENDITELSLAVLTNPTGDSHYGLNAEVAYQLGSADIGAFASTGTDEENILTASLEAIAVIP